MIMNTQQQNYENAKKCVQALKNSFQPMQQFGNTKGISQESCLKLLRGLALKELEDIAQQEKEDRLRYNEQNLQLLKRKSSQMRIDHSNSFIYDDINDNFLDTEQNLEIVKIKKIKRNEIISDSFFFNKQSQIMIEEQQHQRQKEEAEQEIEIEQGQGQKAIQGEQQKGPSQEYENREEQKEEENNNRNKQQFHEVESQKHLEQIQIEELEGERNEQYLAQHNKIQGQYFEECFRSQLISMIYANFKRPSSDIAQLFHSLDNVSQMFKHLTTIYKNQSIALSSTAKTFEECFGYVVEKIIIGKEECLNDIIKENKMVEQFINETKIRTEQVYILLSRVIQHEYRQDTKKFQETEFSPLLKFFTDICTELLKLSNKDDLKIAFKYYIKINHRISLLEKAVKFEKPIQGENLLKEAFKEKLYLLKNQSLDSNESDHISSFLVFLYDLLTKSETQFIDQNESKRILELLKDHVNQSQNIFDFYKKFPEYFEESVIADYKNIKDLQANTCSQFKDKFSFLPVSKIQSTHLILLKRFLQEDSWFITKENMGEFINYFTEKIERDDLLEYLLKYVTEEKQNLNTLLISILLKIASSVIRESDEKNERNIQNIIMEMVINKVWNVHNNFKVGLKIYFKDLCTPKILNQLYLQVSQYFTSQPQGKEILSQFEEQFEMP